MSGAGYKRQHSCTQALTRRCARASAAHGMQALHAVTRAPLAAAAEQRCGLPRCHPSAPQARPIAPPSLAAGRGAAVHGGQGGVWGPVRPAAARGVRPAPARGGERRSCGRCRLHKRVEGRRAQERGCGPGVLTIGGPLLHPQTLTIMMICFSRRPAVLGELAAGVWRFVRRRQRLWWLRLGRLRRREQHGRRRAAAAAAGGQLWPGERAVLCDLARSGAIW